MKFIFRYLKPYYTAMLIGLGIKSFGTLIELALPYILQHILDVVVPYDGRVSMILLWGGGMVLCALLALLCNIKANRMASKVARDSAYAIRKDLFSRSLTLSGKQIDHFTIPSLETRITTDTYNIQQFVGRIQRLGVRAPLLLLGGLIVSLVMDFYLSLVMLAIMPVIFIVVYFVSRYGARLYTNVQKAVDGMIRVVREDSRGIRVIKALSRVEKERDRYDDVNDELVKAEKKASLTMGFVNPVMSLLMNLGITFVVVLGASRVMGGETEPGTIVAFTQYFTMISNATLSVTRIFMMSTKSMASAERVRQVVDAPEDPVLYPETEFPPVEEEPHVVFDKVSFSYENSKNALLNVSFSLPKGGTLGVIGATGSGKTTLTSLLMRVYDVESGAVRIGGRDVRTIPQGELKRKFGVAMQNDFLYADTIYENIRFGRELTTEQIETAARMACAHEFISAMEEGYRSVLAPKGANLSGGQKQRLLIARALAGEPEILILDDSFSALDYKTDAALRANLKTCASESTSILVAQRVSSVMHADLILVLEEGEIIGRGTHEELLETCSVYQEIHRSQMGGAFLD
ncbi:MAG: ABC transporter ATP-binding protein [Clostridia bacterium]|nr:ABC transporter ATP-binding protein [Clostridia bacterium]